MQDVLNMLFDAALEFGSDWRRHVSELAAERLPELSAAERAELAATIASCRDSLEAYLRDAYECAGGDWGDDQRNASVSWIRKTYPWMTDANIRHAISQGVYYAWRG